MSNPAFGDGTYDGDEAARVDPIDTVMGEQQPEAHIPEAAQFDEMSKMQFNGEVARVFEDQVIPRQIPGYKQMRYRLLHVARYFTQPNTQFVDLGTSQGRMIRDLAAAFAGTEDPRLVSTAFVGLDYEEDMLDHARILFDELEANEQVVKVANKYRRSRILTNPDADVLDLTLKHHDLRKGLPGEVVNPSVIASIYTLQFIPIEHRPRLLRQVYDRLTPGGAFIWAEKVVGTTVDMDDMFAQLYYDDKSRNGIPDSDILKKRQSLEGFLMPFTDQGNRELLRGAGFRSEDIDIVWKDLNFQFYVAIKR